VTPGQSARARVASNDRFVRPGLECPSKEVPFATIKIGRSVVAGLATSAEDRAIALSIVTLAEHLGLNCVGVGVETTEQFDFLTYHGCDKAQGLFISWPLSAAGMTTLLSDPDLLG
jgi:EAL domain-containing protein (putative c-di-GMP-specific phosphodiesterase class I)